MIVRATARGPSLPKPHPQHFLRLISPEVMKDQVCLMRLMDEQDMLPTGRIYGDAETARVKQVSEREVRETTR